MYKIQPPNPPKGAKIFENCTIKSPSGRFRGLGGANLISGKNKYYYSVEFLLSFHHLIII